MKNIETPSKTSLSKLLDDLKCGSYVIPDFQREFEWQPWDIAELIKSIFMDYYIGTLLLWKAENENIHVLKCERIYGYEGESKPQHIVLDGQQRLTALYYALFAPDKTYPGRKSRCYFFVKIKDLLDENYDDAFYYEWDSKKTKNLISNPELQYKRKVFPLSVIGNDIFAFLDWIRDYKGYWTENGNDSNSAEKEAGTLEKILRELILDYQISYIELDREIPVSKVCDIFTKINNTGVRLSIFDLLNALLRPHDIYLKKMWRNASDTLSFTDPSKMKIYVLQVMSILKQAYCSPRYLYYLVPGAVKTIKKEDGSKDKIVLINSEKEFESSWEEAVKAIEKTIQALKNSKDFGAILPKFVPYPSIIPALAAINKHVDENDYEGKGKIKNKIRKWYWASIFTQNYSSAVESQTTKDFNDLKKWFADDELVPDVVTQFKNDYKYLDLKRENKQSSAIYNAIFNLLILKGARDWQTFDFPEYSSLDDHHIIPQSWGKKRVGDDINSILNKTPLSEETNRGIINHQMPSKYLKKMIETNGEDEMYRCLESHLISKKAVEILLREDFDEKDYYEFINERKNTIINAIEALIFKKSEEKLKIDYSEILQQDEGDKLEFKSTFYYNIKEGKPDKTMKSIIIKTIAGFLNASGGRLIIGVTDDGTVYGLDKDYEINFRGDRDGLLQDFRSTLNKYFIDGTITRHISYHIEEVEGKEILVVDIETSREEVFLRKDTNNVLYVRRGNKTDPITDPQEVHKYISDNWKM